MVDRRETLELAQLFCDQGLMLPIDNGQNARFTPSKSSIYTITEKGQRVAGWVTSSKSAPRPDAQAAPRGPEGTTRDSNTNRMTIIIRDAALRLLFREFLRDTHCEENLAFYLDVRDFLANYNNAKRHYSVPKLEIIRETLAAAYSLYNAFLAPGSPCELNIDHSLRTSLAARMTRAVGDDDAMIKSLDEVATLFDQAQNSVFKLMASVSLSSIPVHGYPVQLLTQSETGLRAKVYARAKVSEHPAGAQSGRSTRRHSERAFRIWLKSVRKRGWWFGCAMRFREIPHPSQTSSFHAALLRARASAFQCFRPILNTFTRRVP